MGCRIRTPHVGPGSEGPHVQPGVHGRRHAGHGVQLRLHHHESPGLGPQQQRAHAGARHHHVLHLRPEAFPGLIRAPDAQAPHRAVFGQGGDHQPRGYPEGLLSAAGIGLRRQAPGAAIPVVAVLAVLSREPAQAEAFHRIGEDPAHGQPHHAIFVSQQLGMGIVQQLGGVFLPDGAGIGRRGGRLPRALRLVGPGHDAGGGRRPFNAQTAAGFGVAQALELTQELDAVAPLVALAAVPCPAFALGRPEAEAVLPATGWAGTSPFAAVGPGHLDGLQAAILDEAFNHHQSPVKVLHGHGMQDAVF